MANYNVPSSPAVVGTATGYLLKMFLRMKKTSGSFVLELDEIDYSCMKRSVFFLKDCFYKKKKKTATAVCSNVKSNMAVQTKSKAEVS